MRTVQHIVERLRAEYLEMPGLRLKREEIERLCGIEQSLSEAVLDALLEAKFLSRKQDGYYTRLTEGAIIDQRPIRMVSRRSMCEFVHAS
jgi:hypothetical protein